MRLFSALAFWAISLFLIIWLLVHLYQEQTNDFVNASFLVGIAFCFLMAATSKK
jgi:hypothetical protein